MSLKLKALGLSLIAALVMSAVAVVNAGATQSGHFTTDNATGSVTTLDITEVPGTAHQVKLHSFGSVVECSHATYSASIAAGVTTTEDITVIPSYTSCQASGPAVVHMNGCDYTFTSRAAPEKNHGTVHLVCPGSQGPVVTVNGPFSSHDCWIEITPNQTPTGGVSYTTTGTSGSGHEITADVTVTGIHATIITGSGQFFVCGTSSHTTTEATMEGAVTIKGTSGGNQVGITAT